LCKELGSERTVDVEVASCRFFLRTVLHHVYLNVLGICISVACFGIVLSLDISLTPHNLIDDFDRCEDSLNNLLDWNLVKNLEAVSS
jgi:hypothetical protein